MIITAKVGGLNEIEFVFRDVGWIAKYSRYQSIRSMKK
jgi:hypothetical protein